MPNVTPLLPISRVRPLLLWVGGVVLFALGGCRGEDEIRAYEAPHPSEPKSASSKTRLLAALFPRNERIWAIKLMGPEVEVAEHADAFRRFVQSVRMKDKGDPPITWTVPEGWRQTREVALSFATFALGAGDRPLQVTVTPVTATGPQAILDNINRWRGQLGLSPIASGQLADIGKEITVDGVAATLVDMTGPGVTRRTGRP